MFYRYWRCRLLVIFLAGAELVWCRITRLSYGFGTHVLARISPRAPFILDVAYSTKVRKDICCLAGARSGTNDLVRNTTAVFMCVGYVVTVESILSCHRLCLKPYSYRSTSTMSFLFVQYRLDMKEIGLRRLYFPVYEIV